MLTTWRKLLKGLRVQRQEHLLRSKVRTYRNPGEPKDNGLVLVVQDRLAWGKVNKNNGVYYPSPMSNTKEYSEKNILEKAGQFQGTKDQNGVQKRRAVNRA